ncbi:eCIS core domain-containing protein [Spongiimicrobium salis]|uniref:eCIS core domain-containing protein n=1 Tax=Spongiimicrobium salis TaxID=1667022 RepID=UPI00374CEE29
MNGYVASRREQKEPHTTPKKNSGIAKFQFQDHRPASAVQQQQMEMMHEASLDKSPPLQRKANHTGLPDNLKSGIENLSGYAMDDVKVHYNSSKPEQLNAHAYAQGTDIHLGAGQEKHLPHEAWHVVQQKQGRVKPTRQLKGKVQINDDAGLEKEADVMGAKAMQSYHHPSSDAIGKNEASLSKNDSKSNAIAQMWWGYQATYESDFYYVKAMFRQRVADKTATTGSHNYAYNLNNDEIAKSGTSGHAEILLLSSSSAKKGDEVTIISEYKPCKFCQEQIEKIEESRGIKVKVIWLLGYEEKGDGDKDATRSFYRKKKWLLGGGEYVYTVNTGFEA